MAQSSMRRVVLVGGALALGACTREDAQELKDTARGAARQVGSAAKKGAEEIKQALPPPEKMRQGAASAAERVGEALENAGEKIGQRGREMRHEAEREAEK
jgi:hypothetical protein